jgi:hypothetical protein
MELHQSASKGRGSTALGGRMDTAPSPSASPTWNRSWPISSTPQGRLRRTLCLGLKHPRVGRPFSFRARRLMSLHPGLKRLGYSVRPLRGHRKMSKLQRLRGTAALLMPANENPSTIRMPVTSLTSSGEAERLPQTPANENPAGS